MDNLDEAISALQSRDLVVFAADGEPIGAYPFTMDEREHRVLVNGHTVHAMCALDALAISPMLTYRREFPPAAGSPQTR